MTGIKNLFNTAPDWTIRNTVDHLITINGVQFKFSAYAAAIANNKTSTRIILASWAELDVAMSFEEFTKYINNILNGDA
jgi:hypothetical protein